VKKKIDKYSCSDWNTVKNWREITLKNSRLLISAALEFLKNQSQTYLPNLVYYN
jgi:hypothetical protein